MVVTMMIKVPICVLTILMTVTTFVYAKESTDHQLYNRIKLTERLTADDQADLNLAEFNLRASERALTLAQKVLITAQNNRTATANKRVALSKRHVTVAKGKADTSKDALALIQNEFDKTSQFVRGLKEEQVLALNRSLNDELDSTPVLDIDSVDLALIENANIIQINAFTQAFKQQARFNQKADEFTARYKATGDEKFIERAARMKNKGRVQKATFINKIAFFGASTSASEGDVKEKTVFNNKENSLTMILAKIFIKR